MKQYQIDFPQIHQLNNDFIKTYFMFTLAAIFVVDVMVNNKKYTFNSSINVEIVAQMCRMFENNNKSNFMAKYPKENTYRTIK